MPRVVVGGPDGGVVAFVGGEGGDVVDVDGGGEEEDALDCVGGEGGWGRGWHGGILGGGLLVVGFLDGLDHGGIVECTTEQ